MPKTVTAPSLPNPAGAGDLLAELAGRGVRLWNDSGKLRFRAPSGALLAEHRQLLAHHKAQVLALLAANGGDFEPTYPVTHSQRALWFEQHLQPDSHAYNIHFSLRILDDLDVGALRRALATLVERHSALRSRYPERGGDPVLQLPAHMDLPFEMIDAAGWSDAELEESLLAAARRPFELDRGPVIRILLFRSSARRHQLLLTVHHIAIDFSSYSVLLEELAELYQAALAGRPSQLAPVACDYADFVLWQNKLLDSPDGEAQGRYWHRQLGNRPASVALATDRPRGSKPRGASVAFTPSPRLTDAIDELATARGTTRYAVLLAGYQGLLRHLTGQEDFIIGSPMGGRSRPELQRLVGYLSNMVLLRARPSARATFGQLLDQVHDSSVAAIENQDYPLPMLCEQMRRLERSAGAPPMVNAVFAYWSSWVDRQGLAALQMGSSEVALEFAGMKAELVPLPMQEGQFDLTVVLYEYGGILVGSLLYRADLFERRTIEQLAADYESYLARAVEDPGRRLDEIAAVLRSRAADAHDGAPTVDAAEDFDFD